MTASEEAARALAEREKRLSDVIELRVPDRVPIAATFDYFPARYVGISTETAFYDPRTWKAACKKTLIDFAPDVYFVAIMVPGKALELLGCRQLTWPGHGAPRDGGHQFQETEYMKPEELEDFINDPSDYTVRTYLPRIFSAFAPLRDLPQLTRLIWGYGEIGAVELFTRPDFVQMMEAVVKAGREFAEWNKEMGTIVKELEDLGFPPFSIALTQAPYDWLPDFLRGMKGSMLDLYRQPEKVLEACEKLLPVMINKAVSVAKASGNPRVFIPLHRGSDGFMSLKQFEKFYWPGLKKVCLALINEGLVPWVFFEGDYTSRLEYLLELPKGKVIAHLDSTDIFRAKEVLGGHMCIMGNMPGSLLQAGTKEEVVAYTKKLIDVVGKDGGYIMACRSPMDETDPALVKVWMDFTKEYGVYR